MNVISAVVGRQKTQWLTRVSQHLIGIDDTVENAAGANPSIERLACRFVLGRIEARVGSCCHP
jgi:hypothetical protein